MLHRRCESIEASLRGQIVDLQGELQRTRDALERAQDRLMAVLEPEAHRRVASSAPAARMPVLPQFPGARPATAQALVPGQRPRPVDRSAVRPALTPDVGPQDPSRGQRFTEGPVREEAPEAATER